MILFDTDICVELLRGNKKIIQRRSEYSGEVGISFMTVAELYYGAENAQNTAESKVLVDKFLLTVDVVWPDIAILKRFGEIKSELRRRKTPLPDADLFIGAASLEKCEALITGHTKHFEKIPGLKIENWIR